MSAAPPVVYVVDDDDSFRTAIARLLRAAGFETREYPSAGDFLLEPPTAESNGCVLLDMRMPGPSGLDLQEALNRSRLGVPVIFLTGHGDVTSGVQAMKSGAADFLTKPVESRKLLDAVRAALTRRGHDLEERQILGALRARYEQLTGREREVFHAVVAGKLNKQIGGDLGISERTVKEHRGRVMEKMAAASLAELVHQANILSRP